MQNHYSTAHSSSVVHHFIFFGFQFLLMCLINTIYPKSIYMLIFARYLSCSQVNYNHGGREGGLGLVDFDRNTQDYGGDFCTSNKIEDEEYS